MKKYRLKKEIKMIISCIILLFVLFNILSYIDRTEQKKAAIRCGGENNIIKKYTKSGDIYYICK